MYIYICIRCKKNIYIYIYLQRTCLVREITAAETLIFTPQLVVKPVISHSKKSLETHNQHTFDGTIFTF